MFPPCSRGGKYLIENRRMMSEALCPKQASAVRQVPEDKQTSARARGTARQAIPASLGGEIGGLPALAARPVGVGRLSIAGSRPLPPSCRRRPNEAPSMRLASASRCGSLGGWYPACSRWHWCRPGTVEALLAGVAGLRSGSHRGPQANFHRRPGNRGGPAWVPPNHSMSSSTGGGFSFGE